MFNKYLLTIVIAFTATTSFAALEDEIILEDANKAWTAEKVAKHSVWKKPACIAHTETTDGESTLEVISYYDEANDSFLEPEVNVITTFDVSFLDVTVKLDGIAKKFAMTPVLPSDASLVGARALFGDRETLVSRLRQRNSVDVRYIDTDGDVKTLNFSLSGSSAAIREQFKACELEFKKLPEALPVVDELN